MKTRRPRLLVLGDACLDPLSAFSKWWLVGLLPLLLATSLRLSAADTPTGETNPTDSVRAALQLQEQVHNANLAIERTRQESGEAARRNLELLLERLRGLEQSLNQQREAERAQAQIAQNRLLLVMGSFTLLGCSALLLTAYFQWRAVGRLAEFSLVTQSALATVRSSPSSAPAPTETFHHVQETLERIERRLQELETPADTMEISRDETISASSGHMLMAETLDLDTLLSKGTAFLNQDQPEPALILFERMLNQDPRHVEALVKKGEALEGLGRVEGALACYDEAVNVEPKYTLAYLHKGRLLNRLQRHDEALRCYEQALKT